MSGVQKATCEPFTDKLDHAIVLSQARRWESGHTSGGELRSAPNDLEAPDGRKRTLRVSPRGPVRQKSGRLLEGGWDSYANAARQALCVSAERRQPAGVRQRLAQRSKCQSSLPPLQRASKRERGLPTGSVLAHALPGSAMAPAPSSAGSDFALLGGGRNRAVRSRRERQPLNPEGQQEHKCMGAFSNDLAA